MLKLQVGGEHGAVHHLLLYNQSPIQAMDALSHMQPLLEQVCRRLGFIFIVKVRSIFTGVCAC